VELLLQGVDGGPDAVGEDRVVHRGVGCRRNTRYARPLDSLTVR
jgi:hypothetical protein